MTVNLGDVEATERLGKSLAVALPEDTRGWMILLKGELGAGKSTLARALLREFGHEGKVPSPTYTLVEPYQVGARLVYHVDLFRISDPGELDFLGWSDLRDGLLLVEWPERVEGLIDQADWLIELGYSDPGRSARVSAGSERGASSLSRVLL